MKILADENVPLLSKFFGEFGEIVTRPGREITAEDAADANVLIVRSVTRVDEQLLQGSAIKFVGSCTIGTDHMDLDYMKDKGIVYANAPGSNANSVVEYVLSCLSVLTETNGIDLDEVTVGIIGYGNVGSRLGNRLARLGVQFKAYDPLLKERPLVQSEFTDDDIESRPDGHREVEMVSFEEVCQCDVVTLHVPLTHDGEYPTYHLLDGEKLKTFNDSQILINTARGPVIDNVALLEHLENHPDFTVILDVWESEPDIDVALARRIFLGTPHIAGYSLDGKVCGTEMVYQALCRYLGFPTRHKAGQFMEEPPLSRMAFTSNADVDWCIHTAIRACYDVRHDHSNLRATLGLPLEERVSAFDALRKNYRCRREFYGTRIQLKQVDSELHRKFKALGFNLKT